MKLGRGLLSDKQDRHTMGHPSTGGKVGQNSLPEQKSFCRKQRTRGGLATGLPMGRTMYRAPTLPGFSVSARPATLPRAVGEKGESEAQIQRDRVGKHSRCMMSICRGKHLTILSVFKRLKELGVSPRLERCQAGFCPGLACGQLGLWPEFKRVL